MFHSAFEKNAEKVVLLVVKGLIQIFVKFRAEKVLRTFLSPNILLMRGIKYWLRKQLCSFENERLIHSITQFGSWFLKKISQGTCFFTAVHACTRSLNEACRKCGLVFFIDEHGYILKEEGRSFKTLLKESYPIALGLKNVKHGIEHDIDNT